MIATGKKASFVCDELKTTFISCPDLARKAEAKEKRYTVRPVTRADVDIIFNWLVPDEVKKTHQKRTAPPELQESYQAMEDSGFAKAFMLLEGERPVCSIDIFSAMQDHISLYTRCRPGDYGLFLVHDGPLLFLHGAVKMAIGYFFSYPEVERLLIHAPLRSPEWSHLLSKCGFILQPGNKIDTYYKGHTLYDCTRTSYYEAYDRAI